MIVSQWMPWLQCAQQKMFQKKTFERKKKVPRNEKKEKKQNKKLGIDVKK